MAIETFNLNDSGSTIKDNLNANFADLDTTKADLASPALTGNPTAPTQSANDNSTKIATTAYVDTKSYGTTSTAGVSAGPNCATTTTTVTYTHSLGRTPTIIRLDGVGRQMSGTGSPHSHGVYNSSGNRCVYMPGTSESVTPLSSAVFSVHLKGDTGIVATGVVGNVGATTFDIVWTTGGTEWDLSTYTVFMWEAQ